MKNIKRVIAVLNDFEKADIVLKKALEFSSQKDAVLEVLYVHEEPLFDLPDFFQLQDDVEDDIIDAQKIKKELKHRIKEISGSQECAVLVYINDTVSRLEALTKGDTSVFVITAYYEKITQKLVQKNRLPILVIKNDIKDYQKIVIPVDLTKSSYGCIDLAKMIFPQVNKRLLYDYRYVIDYSLVDTGYLGMSATEPVMNSSLNEEVKQNKLELFEALKKEMELEGDFIEESLLIEEDLSNFINTNHFDLTILSFDRDFLSIDSISLLLLKMLHTDILICPILKE